MTVAVTVNPGSGTVITAVDRVGTIRAILRVHEILPESTNRIYSNTHFGF